MRASTHIGACKDAKCVHKAYCILAILAESCDLARMQDGSIHGTTFQGCKMLASTHIASMQECKMRASLTRMQNACIHPSCILARRERASCQNANDKMRASCILAFLQNAKCKMQSACNGADRILWNSYVFYGSQACSRSLPT